MTISHFARLVARYRRLFCLQDWNVTVSAQPGESLIGEDLGTFATITSMRGSKSADICYAADREEGELEQAALHEVLHLVLRDLGDMEDIFLAELSSQARQAATAVLKQSREDAVLRLERAFMELTKGEV